MEDMSEREEIMDLIRNEYDPAPSHYKMGDDWDDGAGRIADAILADRLIAIKAERERCAKIAAAHQNHSGLEIAELIREDRGVSRS